jgi:hypothetical protein
MYSIFDGYAHFKNTRFSTYGQSFSGGVFNGDLSFACASTADERVREMVALHLSSTTLAKGARFDGRHFRHREKGDQFDIFLNDATVSDHLLFLDVVCDGTVVLDRVNLTAPITVLAPHEGRISLNELTLTEPLIITARVVGQTRSTGSSETTELTSLANATLEAPLTLGDGIALTRCRLIGTTGLDQVRITAVDPRWSIFRRRRVVADELLVWNFNTQAGSAARRNDEADNAELLADDLLVQHPRQVESIYRQLRAALEASKAAPAAADFYYGEMEMRRLASPLWSVDRTLLTVYKLVSGYGLRAYRALATYLVLILAASMLLRYQTTWFVAEPDKVAGSTGLSFVQFWDVFAITARSSVGFISAMPQGLTAAGTLLFIGLRLIGPAADRTGSTCPCDLCPSR